VDDFLNLEPMWDGLIMNPLSKALRAEEEGCLRLGNLIQVGTRVVWLLVLQIFLRGT
jgi:hypothetical protein